jgi:cold shock CspA family protein
MKEECIFCKKNHLKLNSSFEEFIFKNKLDSEEIISFTELLKNELASNHWNEAFCMINTVSRFNQLPKNTVQAIFLITVNNIKNCIISDPNIDKIQKYIKTLTIEINRVDEEQKLGQYRVKTEPNEYDVEMDRLGKILLVLDKKTSVLNCEKSLDIDVQLKNYLIYRLVSFYDFKVADTITKAIDRDNRNKMTYGKKLLEDDKGIQYKIDNLVVLILQNEIYSKKNDNFSLNFKVEFMKFLNEIIQVSNSDLKKYFEDEHQSNWLDFLSNIKKHRNKLTHEFTDVDYSLEELKSIMNLTQIFCYAFPKILKILIALMGQQTMEQEKIQEVLLKLNELESIHAKLVDTNSFFNLFQQHFDQENFEKVQKLKEENFEKNKQKGTFEGWNANNPHFGFIQMDGNGGELYVRKPEVMGIIKEGDSVEFLVGPGKDDRPEAKNLKKTV